MTVFLSSTGNILVCSPDVFLPTTTSIPATSSFHFHWSCLVTEDEGKACPDCTAMSYLQGHWKRWTNGPPKWQCCSHLNHCIHLILLKELLEEYFCHISLQHIYFYVNALWLRHIQEITKNSLILYFPHGILTILVNIQDEFPCFGQAHLKSFYSIVLKVNLQSIKRTGNLRIFNRVDLSFIKIQWHGWVLSLLWSWERSPLPQRPYKIIQKQYCIKKGRRWDFQLWSNSAVHERQTARAS